MTVQQIEHDGRVLAILVRNDDWGKGLNFISNDEDFLQVGTWWYDQGKLLQPHIHLEAPRQVSYTQEVIYVREGRIRADIFTDGEEKLMSVEVEKGDLLVLLGGGHGYEILEDDTQVIEVKNGPYVGADQDRRRIG